MKWGGGGSPLTSGYGEGDDDDEYDDVDDVDTPHPNKCQRWAIFTTFYRLV